MEITEVRVKLVEKASERLRAFCSITLDGDFVIRDLKIIGGTNGAFVAMPSRKLADRCSRCGCKNHLRAKYCNECGQKLNEGRAPKDAQGRAKLHADVAHPINAACRERIQATVVKAYEAEAERAKSPDYKPPKFDDFEHDLIEEEQPLEPASTEDQGKSKDKDTFGDYNSLIADLKREAATRQQERRSWQTPDTSYPEAEQEASPEAGLPPSRQPPGQPEPVEHHDRPEEGVSQAQASPERAPAVDSAGSDQAGPVEKESSVPDGPPASSASPSPSVPLPQPLEEDREESDAFGAGL